MSRARNAVIIIILCIIGAYSFKKGPQLGLSVPNNDTIKDAVAGAPSSYHRSTPKLTLASGNGEDLRDAVAGHAVGTPGNHGNTLDDVGPPPRGNGIGGFGPQANNPGQNFTPPPPPLSQSGPGGSTGGNETSGGPCNEGNGVGAGQGCINGNRDHNK
jgi:hypothetical protein